MLSKNVITKGIICVPQWKLYVIPIYTFVVELISLGFPLVDCLIKQLNLVFEFVNDFICCLDGIKNVQCLSLNKPSIDNLQSINTYWYLTDQTIIILMHFGTYIK